jgi:DNA-directed RNA polymerase
VDNISKDEEERKKEEEKNNSLFIERRNMIIGGYYTREMRKIVSKDHFIHSNPKLLEQSTESVEQLQTKCINYINKQKFKINKLMFEYLTNEFNKEQSIFFKGFNKLHIKTSDIKNLNKEERKQVLSHNTIYNLNKRILDLAYIFKDVCFYIPTFMDFRGRIYPYPSGLEYQGNDLSRCLIEFYDGCDLDEESEKIVYQYLANTSGKSHLIIKNKEK